MDKAQPAPYVLGHSEPELQRLIEQSRFYGELTKQFLRSAGLEAGMQVLDIGCGAGDVSMLAATLVGASGKVLGIDKSPHAVGLARRRAEMSGLTNVAFQEGELLELGLNEPFDALVGRLVLMYLPDPAAALRVIAQHVRPGGIIAFQEMDMSNARGAPESPLYSKCGKWIIDTFQQAGFETDMGSKLFTTFREAGLPGPQMTLGARIGGGADMSGYEYTAHTVRSLLPMMERLGVATAQEVEIETLADRLRDEVVAGGGVMISPAMIGAWTRKNV
jgi:ubiquinone/menaquinone biosynthesis C-methylase UbiE